MGGSPRFSMKYFEWKVALQHEGGVADVASNTNEESLRDTGDIGDVHIGIATAATDAFASEGV
jgi:hypothetical protein